MKNLGVKWLSEKKINFMPWYVRDFAQLFYLKL